MNSNLYFTGTSTLFLLKNQHPEPNYTWIHFYKDRFKQWIYCISKKRHQKHWTSTWMILLYLLAQIHRVNDFFLFDIRKFAKLTNLGRCVCFQNFAINLTNGVGSLRVCSCHKFFFVFTAKTINFLRNE